MQKISFSTNTANAAGEFIEGNPATGLGPTLIKANWMNAIQRELVAVVQGAGLALDAYDDTQVLQAVRLINNLGRLLNIRVFSAAGVFTYLETPGTNSVVVKVQGAGGGGAGAPATGAGLGSLGSAGGAGAYAEGFFTSGFSGATITVGAGGTGVSGSAGNSGGSSSFGTLISCPGGKGGNTSGPSSGSFVAVTGNSNAPSGGNLQRGIGQGADLSICFSPSSLYAGRGGMSLFGAGASSTGADTPGAAATASGAGGGGTARSSGGSALTGGTGGPGVVIVWEYS